MTIKIYLEDGELSEQADISQPFLPAEEIPTERHKSFSERRINEGSIATLVLSTSVVVMGSLEFGYSVLNDGGKNWWGV